MNSLHFLDKKVCQIMISGIFEILVRLKTSPTRETLFCKRLRRVLHLRRRAPKITKLAECYSISEEPLDICFSPRPERTGRGKNQRVAFFLLYNGFLDDFVTFWPPGGDPGRTESGQGLPGRSPDMGMSITPPPLKSWPPTPHLLSRGPLPKNLVCK